MKTVQHYFKNSKKIAFLAVQTVFEGHTFNTKNKLKSNQKKYNLPIPMGHDANRISELYPVPETMMNYRSRGTPWVVIVDQEGKVVYNDFHIRKNVAIDLIENLIKKP